jgi:hypothetical protein
MDMPQVNENHRRMSQLTGEWVGESVFTLPGIPDHPRANSRMKARVALGGFHLIVDWEQERDGKVDFEGHGVLGWDNRGQCYTMHWFDSMGFEHGAPAYGPWENDTLALTHETNHAGHSRQVYELGGDNVRFLLQKSQDGREWNTIMESKLRRRS